MARSYDDRDDVWNRDRNDYRSRSDYDNRDSYGSRYNDRYDNRRGPIERAGDEVRSWFDNEGGRGPMDRAGDEVRSWFGDDDAERRRRMDERREDRREERRERFDYDRGSDYRHNYGSGSYDSDRVRTDLNRNQGNWGSDRSSYGGQSHDNRGSYGSQSHGSQSYGNQSYGNQSYGNQSYGNQSQGRQNFDNRGLYGNQNSGRSSGSWDNDRRENRGWDTGRGLDSNRGSYSRGYDNDRDWNNRGRDDRHDRGLLERAGDEVRSWFGDDEAERRRRMDVNNDAREEYGYYDHRRNRDW